MEHVLSHERARLGGAPRHLRRLPTDSNPSVSFVADQNYPIDYAFLPHTVTKIKPDRQIVFLQLGDQQQA
jgi:hypothetical protein